MFVVEVNVVSTFTPIKHFSSQINVYCPPSTAHHVLYKCTMHHYTSDIYISVSLDDVTRQYAVKSGSGGYTCSICGKSRNDFTAMTDHMEAIHFPSAEGYSCEICLKNYKSKHSLACHVSTYHRKNKD